MTRNYHNAEDLVQEASLLAIKNADKFRNDTNIQAWLVTILKNVFRNWYRSRKYDVRPFDTDRWDQAVDLDPNASLLLEQAAGFIEQMPKIHQLVILSNVLDGKTYEEIAVEQGIPVGTVRSRLFRARQTLEEKLDPK